MANRSTFNRPLPRDLLKLSALSQVPENTNVQIAKELRQLNKGAGPEGYERMLRKLFIDAHARHRGFKLQRLAKEVVASLKEEVAKDVNTALAAVV